MDINFTTATHSPTTHGQRPVRPTGSCRLPIELEGGERGRPERQRETNSVCVGGGRAAERCRLSVRCVAVMGRHLRLQLCIHEQTRTRTEGGGVRVRSSRSDRLCSTRQAAPSLPFQLQVPSRRRLQYTTVATCDKEKRRFRCGLELGSGIRSRCFTIKQWKITQVWQFYDCCTDDFLLAVACESAAQQSKNWTNVTNLDNFPMLVHDALPMKASMLAYLLAPSHTLAVKAVGV